MQRVLAKLFFVFAFATRSMNMRDVEREARIIEGLFRWNWYIFSLTIIELTLFHFEIQYLMSYVEYFITWLLITATCAYKKCLMEEPFVL